LVRRRFGNTVIVEGSDILASGDGQDVKLVVEE
jgi:hypothetical protein